MPPDDLAEQVAALLGDLAEPRAPAPAPAGSEEALAALLAETLDDRCWREFAGLDPLTTEEATRRAVDLYARTEPYLAAPVDVWERTEAAALQVRQVADGYALLSFPWSAARRRALVLPIRVFADTVIRQAGLDEWAQDLGHPLSFDSGGLDLGAALAGREPDEAGLARDFTRAARRFDALELLGRSERGRAALRAPAMQGYVAGNHLDWARRRLATVDFDGMAMAGALGMLAQAWWVAAYDPGWDGAVVFPARAQLREFLEDADGDGLPDWLT